MLLSLKSTLTTWLTIALLSPGLPVAAADVRMSFGEKIPPFCFPETDSGIELEVIGEALAHRGHVLKPSYFPLARIPLAFKTGYVDASMTDLGEDLTHFGGHYGNPAVWYDNVFITLKEKNLTISKPEDLRGLTVLSFQGAIKRYPEWLQPVKDAGNYREENNQFLQALTLVRGRYDVVLSDRTIFKYNYARLKKGISGELNPVQEHRFVTLNLMDYRPVFRDKNIRDDFNAGLQHLRKTGRIQKIYDKYLGK
ncbi:ABC transporter substrate-binding protein [Motiliproteus sp. MSK22-1]|uniref:substrate-binding periplasmic protein n=1 Tax=Motiliproteus sp. MSK22-1 TaxID=1897630 RepID=UPI0018E91367|nr:ABC transporter substrate-binding protein [Motiliproteus sp. MSK22-1]